VARKILEPKTVDKAMIAADPVAALLGYVSTIMAVFGVFERLGLDADQVAILGGAFLGIIATARIFYEKARRLEFRGLQESWNELKNASSSQETKIDRGVE
jgi:hypothetical protein